MRYTARDIRQQQFQPTRFRLGFDPQEVDAFLEEVADDYEELVRENNLLKEQLAALEERTRAMEAREKALQDTLITTQKVSDELKERAQKEADLIVREAQLQGAKLLEEARQEQAKLTAEIGALKRQRRQVAEELLATLSMHQRLVEQGLAGSDAG